MAKKPSERTNRIKPPEELNLTPFIDMITSLMFFLLIFAAMIPVVVIDAPLPKVASTAEEVRKAKEQKDSFDITVWIKESGFVVQAGSRGRVTIPKLGENWDYEKLHKKLIEYKNYKPDEKEITMVPDDRIKYDVMIQTMDAARELVEGDAGFKSLSPELSGSIESLQFNRLYPDVIIGGV